jgi:hypothetical protein
VNTDPLTDQCPLHFYILRILAHLYISAPSPTQPTCWYQVHASHYLLKLIERPSLIYCATYYQPTVGIRCTWHQPICRHQIHAQHRPTCWYQMRLALAHLLISRHTWHWPICQYQMHTTDRWADAKCILISTGGPMPSTSDTNRWANAKRVSDAYRWANAKCVSDTYRWANAKCVLAIGPSVSIKCTPAIGPFVSIRCIPAIGPPVGIRYTLEISPHVGIRYIFHALPTIHHTLSKSIENFTPIYYTCYGPNDCIR